MEAGEQPFRGELFSVDLLQRHARQLSQEHRVAPWKGLNYLLPRLSANEKVLRSYNDRTLEVEKIRRVTPAAEWLLDNFYLVEEQILMARRHLPRSFSRELPHLLDAPEKVPRVYTLAQELISHVDGRIDALHLKKFIAAYQEVQPLKLGELWAIPIMLRLALIENLRRIAVLLTGARDERDEANEWADRILDIAESAPSKLIVVVGELASSETRLTRAFVTEFWQRMQEKSPRVKLVLSWIEERLAEEGTTIEQLVQSESQDQAASQVSVGNSIMSLRFIDAMDWRSFVEELSLAEQTLRADPGGTYGRMDFQTRDAYRHAVERIARRSDKTEWEVAALAVNLAQNKSGGSSERHGHVGYYLYDRGVKELEQRAGLKPSPWSVPLRMSRRFPLWFYLGAIGFISLVITAAILPWPLAGFPGWASLAMGALIWLCTSQLAVGLVNWALTVFIRPRVLPRLDYTGGIPVEARTMVVVPTLLGSAAGIEKLLETMEVHYLGNRDGHVSFALLTDFCDAPQQEMPGDRELLHQVREGIRALNRKYTADRRGSFYLFHRPRLWNERERAWMGHERKRGKLEDFNAVLRSRRTGAFSEIVGEVAALAGVRYVVTLDTDTQLPRDAVRQLAGMMAHPLNRAEYDALSGRVREGYGILQPRVGVNLACVGRSRFAQMFSGDPGIDPYTRAVSDVYQDIFREGSFVGKGIYDVDAFEQAVRGKLPEDRILSHDLLESAYARSGLVTDVQLFEDFPAHYLADAKRRHRWMRGDWQIAAWLLPSVPFMGGGRVENPLSAISRWKILDNLRRCLVPIALTTLLVLAWTVFNAWASVLTLLVVAVVFIPGLVAGAADYLRKPAQLPWLAHYRNVQQTGGSHLGQALFSLTFLPHDAWLSLDAAVRTCGRLCFTKRHLLEWQPASETERRSLTDMGNFWRSMWFAPLLAAAVLVLLAKQETYAFFVALPVLLAWLISPVAAWWMSQPFKKDEHALSAAQTRYLHLVMRKTWRYFETFVGSEDNWLPPDNFQEHPRPILATRTSPTNIGLSMLSTLAAWDVGYLSQRQLTDRLGKTLQTLDKMTRYQGHFYNWYDTRTLQALEPHYISTVDNGNFSGLLLTLGSGLAELAARPWPTSAVFAGLNDTLGVLQQTVRDAGLPEPKEVADTLQKLAAKLAQPPTQPVQELQLLIEAQRMVTALPTVPESTGGHEYTWWRNALEQQCKEHRHDYETAFPWLKLAGQFEELANTSHPGARALGDIWRKVSASHPPIHLNGEFAALNGSLDGTEFRYLADDFKEAVNAGAVEAGFRKAVLENLARRCDEVAQMDFSLLYDPTRKLFSIGYNVTTHRLDESYYDLLASEARLASFVAIALGQVPQEHWFALGRLLTTVESNRSLISWSGSMFEYLMPLLVMPSHEKTLLGASCQSSVERQIEYGRKQGVPWGVSESGYNLTDAHANYQYRAFGVPGLGFKRGLADDLVIAPYATSMAVMIAPEAACQNLKRLQDLGAEGRYGFYEALDYTAKRLPRGKTHVLIQSFMAHHQGMALLALASHLLDRPMQRRFVANPFFKSAELLLQERLPKETALLHPHETETERVRLVEDVPEATYRVFTQPNTTVPEVHLLSNGRYHVMVTNAGGGYSLWNDTALTRWREDVTRDCWGTFVYVRDAGQSGFWSVAHQPTLHEATGYEAIFSQGRAEYRVRAHEIDSHTEIAVSPEDDVEVRRITLTNHSSEARVLELTSFAEVSLNNIGADQAHPAFSKLFIQTEILPKCHALVCSRRPRARGDRPPWMFHLMLVRGEEVNEASYETDRAIFLGRGQTAAAPAAMTGSGPLTNSAGSVLDPAVAIRRTVRVGPKDSATCILVTGSASTREALIQLVEKYQDATLVNRVFELAWTHGLVSLRQLNATEPQAQMFGRLASALLYSHASRRAAPAVLMQNRRGQRNLWSYGISGDLPIVLVRATSQDKIELVREILQAHAYWRLKGLAADLVIVNEDVSTYRQSIHDLIMSLIASGIEAQMLDRPGGIFVRRADQLASEDYILLQATARIVLSDENGSLTDQLQRRVRPDPAMPLLVPKGSRRFTSPSTVPARRDLLFFNGLGGFSRDGREYVITLPPGRTTPAPWVNVIANPGFGTLVTESGGAYTWGENCHELRLTPWHNDPVTDLSGEAFYIRDEHSGRYWSPTPAPARGQTAYTVRHGFGYSVFEHTEEGIISELWVYVAADSPVKFARLVVKNLSGRPRSLSVTGYWEWVLGELRQKNALHVITELDPRTGAILARNPYNTDFEGRTAFVAVTGTVASYTGDRAEFVGRNGTLAEPAAMSRVKLSGKVGAGLDACAALQVNLSLQDNQEAEVIFKLGVAENRDKAMALLEMYRRADACRDAIYMVRAQWNGALGAVRFETPDPALNVLANGWLLYQTISCRFWARTGYYQSSGAYGFRDQLQDAMSLIHAQPTTLRQHILDVAAHQFVEGDVMHWWHPPTNRGVRTHFSDDYLWLPYALCRYVDAIGDTGILEERVSFLEGRPLKPEEESYYDTPRQSGESATLYEHCVRAIRYGLKFGEHGLPLIGCGDWNDGMNLIGEHGKGESVWLAFFLGDVLAQFAKLARRRGDTEFALLCEEQGGRLRENIEQNGWDGEWYRRAYFDNGEPLGSAENEECQIDSLPQSWSALTGIGDPERTKQAMAAVAQRLVRREKRLIQLFDPPFDKSDLEPGYIKGYVPGVRENGGQYTHGAIWTVMAFATMGDVKMAWELFDLINPVRHADTPDGVARYKVEPYVVAADIYSVPPHAGRGGWSWYTGSAGWLYRLATETLLGLRIEVDKLRFEPRVPADWKSYTVHYRYRETSYEITLLCDNGTWSGQPRIRLDNADIPGDYILLQDDHGKHQVEVRFGV